VGQTISEHRIQLGDLFGDGGSEVSGFRLTVHDVETLALALGRCGLTLSQSLLFLLDPLRLERLLRGGSPCLLR